MAILQMFISIFTVLTWAGLAATSMRGIVVAPMLSTAERDAGRALVLVMLVLACLLTALLRTV